MISLGKNIEIEAGILKLWNADFFWLCCLKNQVEANITLLESYYQVEEIFHKHYGRDRYSCIEAARTAAVNFDRKARNKHFICTDENPLP